MVAKSTKWHKVRRGLIWLALPLLVLQFGTYFWYAVDIIPRTGIRNLSDYGLLNDSRFVVIYPESWSTYSDGQKTTLLSEIRTFTSTIYSAMGDVPEEALIYEPTTEHDKARYEEYKKRGVDPAIVEELARQIAAGRRIVGLRNGIRLGCKLESQGLFWMKCSPRHWVSMTGAEGRSDLYVWVLGFWLRVRNYHHVMS